jgi:hypothetical protein
VSYFANSDYYGENYLSDLILSSNYSNADFIGKNNYFKINDKNEIEEVNHNQSYEYSTYINPARSIIKTGSITKKSINEVITDFEGNKVMDDFFALGYSVFSSDNYNYLENITKIDNTEWLNFIEYIEI